ncbi:MAG: gluconate 2-dehydrogenase subunit 3 family protein [Acidobacteria bacterium]|nr:gluconate 2-dehydrogenase subunit 3 family protein [Acidobacteriota bacterium]
MADRVGRDAGPEAAGRRPEGAISRRRFIQGAVAVSAATGAAALPARVRSATPPTPGGAAADAAGAGADATTYRFLTPEQGRALTAVLNRLIPATDVMPGAGDVGIARFIDGVLVDAPHLRPRITSLLHAADAGKRFANLREAEQDARLREMARREKVSFDTLLRAAYTGYYSEPRVLAAIGRGSRPDSRGPTGSFDTRLLDAVRRRGPIYRRVSTAGGPAPGGRS